MRSVTDRPRYHMNVFFSPEDACYIADVPDLKYCSAHGESPEEAVREIQVDRALDGVGGGARRTDPPAARYRPAIYGISA